MQIKFTLLRDGARLPERGHSIDVGLDVFVPEAGTLYPGPNKIPLGFSMDVPVGYMATLFPRSGMASGEKTKDFFIRGTTTRLGEVRKWGVAVTAELPPIDPGYSGEVHAIVTNISDYAIDYDLHTRFGQLVFLPIAYAVPVLAVDDSRGAAGFGSTGVK